MNNYFSLLFERRTHEAEAYRLASIPLKLIKFFPFTDDETMNEKKFLALENQKLWFAAPKTLNDPYEFQCIYVDRRRLKDRNCPDEIIGSFETMLSRQAENWALVSLSGNSLNCLPMWAYYTNDYRGYCVEYDVLKPDAIFKVGYEPKRIPTASIVTNFYAELSKIMEDKLVTNDEVEFYASLLRQQFFLKHESWQHENEYRIIYPASSPDGLLVDIANVGLKTSKIVAGLYCSREHKERLNATSHALGCGDISVSKISGEKYTMLEDLSDE